MSTWVFERLETPEVREFREWMNERVYEAKVLMGRERFAKEHGMTVEKVAYLDELAVGAMVETRGFPKNVRDLVPRAVLIADSEMLRCSSNNLRLERKDLERRVAADVREQARVTLFPTRKVGFTFNPFLWWQIGVMVARVIAYLYERWERK